MQECKLSQPTYVYVVISLSKMFCSLMLTTVGKGLVLVMQSQLLGKSFKVSYVAQDEGKHKSSSTSTSSEVCGTEHTINTCM